MSFSAIMFFVMISSSRADMNWSEDSVFIFCFTTTTTTTAAFVVNRLDQKQRMNTNEKKGKTSGSVPWPPNTKYGDGVSRTDARTWASAEEIQKQLTTHYNSDVMNILRSTNAFCKLETSRIQNLKEICVSALTESGHAELVNKVAASFDETTRITMTWAAVFQEIYEKEDETYEKMARLCQRFWTRCPEYGHPTDNSLQGSVYAVYPFIAETWKKNAQDYASTKTTKKKKKKTKKKIPKKKKKKTSGDLSHNLVAVKKEPTDDITTQDLMRLINEEGDSYHPLTKQTGHRDRKLPISLVTTNANKRKQKISRSYQASLTELSL